MLGRGARGETRWHIWRIVVLALALGVAALVERAHSEKRHAHEVFEQMGGLGAALDDVNFGQVQRDLQGAAGLGVIRRSARAELPPDHAEALAAMHAVGAASGARLVYLLDTAGTTVACTPYGEGATLTGKNYAFRPYFKRCVERGTPTFYAALGVTTGERGIYVSVPVRTEGEVAGVLVAKLGLAAIDARLGERTLPTALVSPDGIVFATNRPDWLYRTVLPLSEEARAALRESRQFADAPLAALGHDLSGSRVTLDGGKYRVAKVAVMDGEWMLAGLFEPPVFDAALFCATAFGVWLTLALASYGYRFYWRMRESKQRFDQLAEQARTFNWEVDVHGRYTYVNHVVEQVLGYRPEELVGRMYFYDLMPPAEREPRKAEVFEGFGRREEFVGYENPALTKDGRVMWLSTNGIPLLDRQGRLVGYRGSDTDITERKLAQERIHSMLDEQQAIFESSLVGIILLQNRIVTKVNRRMAEMLGYQPEELIGEGPQKLHLSMEHYREFGEKYYWRLGEQDLVQIEYPLRHRDGHAVWCVFHGRAVAPPDLSKGAVWVIDDISERRQAEQQLRESEARMTALLRSMQDLVFVLDDNLVFQNFHQPYREDLFVAPEEFVGKRFDEIGMPAEACASIRAALEYTLRTGEVGRAEYELELNGRRAWYDMYATPYRSADGRVCGVTCVARDISALKEVEAALRESEATQRLLLDSIAAAVVVVNPQTHVIEHVNCTAAEMFGAPIERIIGHRCHQFMCPAEEGACPITDGGRAIDNADREMIRADGTRVPILKSVRRIQINGEENLIETFIDLTGRKQVEEALRESEERLAQATCGTGIGIWAYDVGANRLEWDARMFELYGVAPEDYTYSFDDWRRAVEPEALPQALEDFERALRGDREFRIEFPIRRPDGALRWLAGAATVLRDEAGQPLRVVGVNYDITDRKQAEAELLEMNRQLAEATARANEMAVQAQQASAAKSEFLANMSHEIRTPMTAIIGFAEAIMDGCMTQCAVGQREHGAHLETIVRNGQYLLGLINDILDLSKIEAGKLVVERVACAPLQVVAEVESLMRVRSEAKGLALSVGFEGPLPETIQSDPTRLRQILINLIGNAVKFTEAGQVELILRRGTLGSGEPALEFDVRDTGVGMSVGQSEQLFQAFSQADASTTRKFGGTGLGLAISKRLAEALGGDVWLVASEPGHGSWFRLAVATGSLDGVPLLIEPQQALRQRPESATEGGPGGPGRLDCRILLAEDGPDNQRLVSMLLRKVGAEVTIVENGARAVEAALAAAEQGQPFDVILMDMQMPVMDGYTATATLRERGYDGPVVALTAHAMAADRQKCLDAGCDDYASKPIDRARLMEVVRGQLVRRAPRAAGATGAGEHGA